MKKELKPARLPPGVFHLKRRCSDELTDDDVGTAQEQMQEEHEFVCGCIEFVVAEAHLDDGVGCSVGTQAISGWKM